MNIQEEIFRSIENIANKNPSPKKMDIPTIILGVEGTNKYKVNIDGSDKIVKDGIGLNIKVGDMVWVHAMNGNLGELYIISRR